MLFSDDGALSGTVLYDPLRPAEYHVDFVAFSTEQWKTAGLARLQVRSAATQPVALRHTLCSSVTPCNSVTHAQHAETTAIHFPWFLLTASF